ncbi:hypothetical protein WJX73_010451 [Symbiochloris irregularis]|uniref:Uncharacterized protein n=1 Tax=Symbiochloris irregularis TaxID=706552 RepID=A0AAW1P5C7_9CHLO
MSVERSSGAGMPSGFLELPAGVVVNVAFLLDDPEELLDSEQISGAWTDTPAYYTREVLPASLSPQALVLSGVWWVELSCTFKDVWLGRYRLTTRMQLLGDTAPGLGHFDWLDISAAMSVGGPPEKQLGRLHCTHIEQDAGFRRGTWCEVTLGEFEVRSPADVTIRMRNVASSYKQQIAWDGMCLTRLPRQ